MNEENDEWRKYYVVLSHKYIPSFCPRCYASIGDEKEMRAHFAVDHFEEDIGNRFNFDNLFTSKKGCSLCNYPINSEEMMILHYNDNHRSNSKVSFQNPSFVNDEMSNYDPEENSDEDISNLFTGIKTKSENVDTSICGNVMTKISLSQSESTLKPSIFDLKELDRNSQEDRIEPIIISSASNVSNFTDVSTVSAGLDNKSLKQNNKKSKPTKKLHEIRERISGNCKEYDIVCLICDKTFRDSQHNLSSLITDFKKHTSSHVPSQTLKPLKSKSTMESKDDSLNNKIKSSDKYEFNRIDNMNDNQFMIAEANNKDSKPSSLGILHPNSKNVSNLFHEIPKSSVKQSFQPNSSNQSMNLESSSMKSTFSNMVSDDKLRSSEISNDWKKYYIVFSNGSKGCSICKAQDIGKEYEMRNHFKKNHQNILTTCSSTISTSNINYQPKSTESSQWNQWNKSSQSTTTNHSSVTLQEPWLQYYGVVNGNLKGCTICKCYVVDSEMKNHFLKCHEDKTLPNKISKEEWESCFTRVGTDTWKCLRCDSNLDSSKQKLYYSKERAITHYKIKHLEALNSATSAIVPQSRDIILSMIGSLRLPSSSDKSITNLQLSKTTANPGNEIIHSSTSNRQNTPNSSTNTTTEDWKKYYIVFNNGSKGCSICKAQNIGKEYEMRNHFKKNHQNISTACSSTIPTSNINYQPKSTESSQSTTTNHSSVTLQEPWLQYYGVVNGNLKGCTICKCYVVDSEMRNHFLKCHEDKTLPNKISKEEWESCFTRVGTDTWKCRTCDLNLFETELFSEQERMNHIISNHQRIISDTVAPERKLIEELPKLSRRSSQSYVISTGSNNTPFLSISSINDPHSSEIRNEIKGPNSSSIATNKRMSNITNYPPPPQLYTLDNDYPVHQTGNHHLVGAPHSQMNSIPPLLQQTNYGSQDHLGPVQGNNRSIHDMPPPSRDYSQMRYPYNNFVHYFYPGAQRQLFAPISDHNPHQSLSYQSSRQVLSLSPIFPDLTYSYLTNLYDTPTTPHQTIFMDTDAVTNVNLNRNVNSNPNTKTNTNANSNSNYNTSRNANQNRIE